MTTMEKRRSSRKSHRKRNDGGYSDTETDREVSSLTDRAFRSLCIGDEAVYNDSDLSVSPRTQRDRQLAISHDVQGREDRERQELKRTAHESFSLRVQQYGQDWNYRAMYGAEVCKDQQWGVCGDRGTQGRLSATFQETFVAPQHEQASRDLSLYSNGTTAVSSQPHRSHSQVSSLIQAFNSDGQREEAVSNNETSWDKSALMSIERELSEFSSYPQNINSGYFPSGGLFSSPNYYSSEVAAISQMNSASSFMRSSHSMSTQVNCNSNVFMHSEFSPFKVWRDHSRFPFHRGQVSGFVPCSEFQKWYETPMYRELSLQPQQHPSMFSDQGHLRNTFAPAVPMNSQRSTSASSMMHRTSAIEKRCELAGQYRKRAQSTGANRLPPQRLSTASPSSEMSRQVRDTISSVKSLQQKIKMLAQQSLETQSQGGFYDSNYLSPYGPMPPYQMQKSPVYAPREPQQFLRPHSVSPQPVEHAPVRAESRGATPDIKMSSYKSRSASILYNLKDNRKRVKATYSPNKFKGMDTQEKYRKETKDFVIDVPEFPGHEHVNSTEERANRLEVSQYGYPASSPGMVQRSQYIQNSQLEFESPADRNRLNIPQHGYHVHSPGMQQYPQHALYSQPEFINPTDKCIRLNVPPYGHQDCSLGMLQNSQHLDNSHHTHTNPTEDKNNRLDTGPYGYQAQNPRMLQKSQFPQNIQNMQNSQQLYPGQNPNEYYRVQMQREVALDHGLSSYTSQNYPNNKLANGQYPYENTSSFTPFKHGMSDIGEGSYGNRLGKNAAAEIQRCNAIGQSQDYVSKDNSKQQFNEAASGEFTGVDRYNQVKENKYDYNNVYSQDMWGQTNSQEIQRPGIPLAQNYQNINAYQRTNAWDNVQSYNYEQMLMENYSSRPQGTVTSTVANQGPQYPPPHAANAGNLGSTQHNTQQQLGTYRDIYAPPTSHEYSKENKMKENYAPQDNHKYYDQESKKQTTISSQGGVPIATKELGQKKEPAIKENGLKGMQSKETTYLEDSKKEDKVQVMEISSRLQDISGHDAELNEIIVREEKAKCKPWHKEELEGNMFVKCKNDQDKDLPTAEELIKKLREEKSDSDPVELQEVTDKQGHVVELQRSDTEQQLTAQHANTEELKEEAIKCELAVSGEEARTEHVKPEPGHMESAITDQAKETVWKVEAKHTERKTEEERHGQERSESKQAVLERIMENDTNTKSEVKEEVEVSTIKPEISIAEMQKTKHERHSKDAEDVNVINEKPIYEERAENTDKLNEDETNVNDLQECSSKSEPNQPVNSEPDKVEQAKMELAKNKAELIKIKETMKGELNVQKDEAHIDQVNDYSFMLSKKPPVTNPDLDLNHRGADDYAHTTEKYCHSQAANKTSITDKVREQPILPDTDKKGEIVQNSKMDSKKKSTNCEVISETREGNEKTKNTPYDNSAESQYVYSESSKDFKLSVTSNLVDHEGKQGINENASVKQDSSIEKVEKLDVSQQNLDDTQMCVDECKLSKNTLPDSADKGTVVKNGDKMKDVLLEKVDKFDISQQNEPAKPSLVERKLKSSDPNTCTSKETSLKGLAHKEKAQTKQELLTSKIKAHAEKEISAIKEGFAIRDGLKNHTKPLAMSHNMSIRQKPLSQEAYKKQERALNGTTSKVQSSAAVKTNTTTGQSAELPQRQAQNNQTTTVQAATTCTTSVNKPEKSSTETDQKVGYSPPTDDNTGKLKRQVKSLKQDDLDEEDPIKNTLLQLELGQNKTSSQDDSLKIMGIMVTVRERNPLECNEQKDKSIQKLNLEKHGSAPSGAETNVNIFSQKVIVSQTRDEQDYNETMDIKSEKDSMTALESTENIWIDCTTEKIQQQESSLPLDRPQSETQLRNHLPENVVPITLTVPAKNKLLAATQPITKKQDTIVQEIKEYVNRTPNVAFETTDIKGQDEITGISTKHDLLSQTEMNRETSSTSNYEQPQKDNLHIDSIAIRVVPAATEKEITTGSISSGSVTANETKEITGIFSNNHQENSPSNDDVQRVLSSVRKQAQLLKNGNQQTINGTTGKNTENDHSKTENKILDQNKKPPNEEGYFQVEKRNNETKHNNNNDNDSIEQTLKAVSQGTEYPNSQSNSDAVNNKSQKEASHTELQKFSSVKMQDLNTITSKQTGNSSDDKSNSNEKPVSHSHHTRRHHMIKDRQRDLSNTRDGTNSTAEVKPKPKAPIPEISALADYARLKVIVSKDNEDNLQELPPNKKEGFFPLIQTRHSRRPVFTLDSQEDFTKQRPAKNQSEASIKVIKEPKTIMFPITEKQHQRTGMFKLGDKDAKDIKANNNTGQQKIIENITVQTQDNKEHNTEEKIKHMLEKSRATLADEEKKAAQREEEQRAREREAIAAQIRERRKKQREAEKQEEGKNKVVDQKQQIHPELKVKDNKLEHLQKNPPLEKQHQTFELNELQKNTKNEDQKLPGEQLKISSFKEQQKTRTLEKKSRKTVQEDNQQKAPKTVEKLNRENVNELQTKAEREQMKYVSDDCQRKTSHLEEQRKRLFLEEQQRGAVFEEQQKNMAQTEEQTENIAKEEQLKKSVPEEHTRKGNEHHFKKDEEQTRDMLEDKQRKAFQIEEQKRKEAAQEEQLRKMGEEERQNKSTITEDQKKRPPLEEQQRNTPAEEKLRNSALNEEQKSTYAANTQGKTALTDEHKGRTHSEEHLRQSEELQRQLTLKEQQKKVAQEEQKVRAALEEQQRKAVAEEQLRRDALIEEEKIKSADEQRKLALKEMQRKAALEEQQRKTAEEEQRRKAVEDQQVFVEVALTEKQRIQATHEEHLRKIEEEKHQRKAEIIKEQKKTALEEQRRKEALKEEQQRATLEDEQRKKRIAVEEQQRKVAKEVEQRKAAEEQQRKAAVIEERRRQATHEVHFRKMVEEKQQSNANTTNEQKKGSHIEEQQRQSTIKEQQRKTAQDEMKQKTNLEKKCEEEPWRKAAIVEEQKKRAVLEQQRKLAFKEKQRKAALEEQERKSIIEQRKAAEEQGKEAIIKEQRRESAQWEQLRKSAAEEQQSKAAITEELKKRVLIEEQQSQLALEVQQRRATEEKQKEKTSLVEQQRVAQKEQQRKMAEEEQQRKAALIEEQMKQAALEEQQRKAAMIEEQKRRATLEKEQHRTEMEEQNQKTVKEKQKCKDLQSEKQKDTHQEEDEKQLAIIREERIRRQIEEAREAHVEQEQRRQHYQHRTEQSSGKISPQNDKKKTQERLAQTAKDTGVFREQDTPQKEDIRARQDRNPGLAAEEQKNITEKTEALQYYSLTSTEIEKPFPPQKRNNTIAPETAEDSNRPLAPVSPLTSLPRSSSTSPAFGTKPSMFKVKDNTVRGFSLTKSIKPRFHKNFGEEVRVGSPMERFIDKNEEDQVFLKYNAGTPVYPEKSPSTPLPEHRPFSRRSLALDEDDCRSVTSNMSDLESFATSAADLADIRALYDSDRPESACSFSSDLSRSLGKPPAVPPKSEKALRRAKRLATRRTKKELTKEVTKDSSEATLSEVANDDAVASPHFAPPVSIALAPPARSNVSSSHSHLRSFQATPHATAPVSLFTASPHTSGPISIPSSKQPGSFATSPAPKSIPQVPSSHMVHQAPKPVTQYQVESGFSQSYTQRRVMQDIGSGQYYVVDVPVEVKTKTFFDPETGKYVQLNVRESNRNATQTQSLKAYPPPHLKPKIQAKPQHTPSANAHYQGYHSYPKGFQSPATSSAPAYQSMTPETITQDKQPSTSSVTHQYGGSETEHSYSPDKTPYMDTVNNTDKGHNVVYSTHGSQQTISEENGHLASRRGSRDIITMSELEDFMEVSDW